MHGSPLTRIRRFQREIFGECPECLLIMDEILKTYLTEGKMSVTMSTVVRYKLEAMGASESW